MVKANKCLIVFDSSEYAGSIFNEEDFNKLIDILKDYYSEIEIKLVSSDYPEKNRIKILKKNEYVKIEFKGYPNFEKVFDCLLEGLHWYIYEKIYFIITNWDYLYSSDIRETIEKCCNNYLISIYLIKNNGEISSSLIPIKEELEKIDSVIVHEVDKLELEGSIKKDVQVNKEEIDKEVEEIEDNVVVVKGREEIDRGEDNREVYNKGQVNKEEIDKEVEEIEDNVVVVKGREEIDRGEDNREVYNKGQVNKGEIDEEVEEIKDNVVVVKGREEIDKKKSKRKKKLLFILKVILIIIILIFISHYLFMFLYFKTHSHIMDNIKEGGYSSNNNLMTNNIEEQLAKHINNRLINKDIDIYKKIDNIIRYLKNKRSKLKNDKELEINVIANCITSFLSGKTIIPDPDKAIVEKLHVLTNKQVHLLNNYLENLEELYRIIKKEKPNHLTNIYKYLICIKKDISLWEFYNREIISCGHRNKSSINLNSIKKLNNYLKKQNLILEEIIKKQKLIINLCKSKK